MLGRSSSGFAGSTGGRDRSMIFRRLGVHLGLIRHPGFLLYALFWAVALTLVWDPLSMWQHAGPRVPAAADMRHKFDLPPPVTIGPAPEEPGLAERDPISDQPIPMPAPVPSALVRAQSSRRIPVVDPGKLRRIMDLGVVQYASASEVLGKTKGASLVELAALLGYVPARNLIVRNYPRSPAVRSAAPMQDAVRFAAGLLAQDAALSKETADLVVTLGNYFSQRGEAMRFARHLVDAISDEDRLQLPDRIAMLGSVFGRIRGVCTGIRRAISAESTVDEDECTDSLQEQLLQYVRTRGEVGIDAEARQRALLLLKEVDGIEK
jgi:hypothetical protein